MYQVNALKKAVEELSKLPGVGEKSARRMAFFLLRSSPEKVKNLCQAIWDLKRKVKKCSLCGNITEEDPCSLCEDESRDRSLLCVVEEPQDVLLFEELKVFRGLYHILGGAISPLRGIQPEDLTIASLVKRVREGNFREVILATDPNLEGDATALYITRLLKPLGVKVTRLAHGLPVGGDLEFADTFTLLRALEGRREVKEG